MANREKDIRLFQRAARQRFDTARFLLAHGFTLDAIYLAGYAVECALKVMILQRTARSAHERMLGVLTKGSKGHDLEFLKGLLKERLRKTEAKDRDVFGRLTDSLKTVASWSTDLRYQVGYVEREEAEHFFDAATQILAPCVGD